MRPADSIEEIIKRLRFTASAKMHDRILSDALDTQEKSKKTKSAKTVPNIWRTIMKSQITKLAAAVTIIAVTLGLTIILDKSVSPAYALEQTIEANHTIQTIHLRIYSGEQNIENDVFMDCWVKYDDAGLVSNFRWNLHGDLREDDDNLKFTVWNEGVLKIWMPLKNVVIVIRVNDAEEYWQNFAERYDPKLLLQQLYDLQDNGTLEIKIDEPAWGGDPIYVEAVNSTDNTLSELVVDPETQLVKELSRYNLEGQEDELVMRIEYLAYNQPIDPSVFKLSGIPDDALVYDQADQLVGLEKGDLTDEEIAIEVVYECLEATIAQDYDEVSRLMEGDPGDTIEIFIEEEIRAGLVRVISFGQPKPHEIWQNVLCVPCEIEVENEEGVKGIVNIIATAKALDYQPGYRWIMRTEIEIDALDRIVKGTIVPGVQVGDYMLGMSKDDVLKSLGKPKHIFYRGERYTLNNLPGRYYMSFSDVSFLIVDGFVEGITVLRPFYKFINGLGVGDSEQDIKQAFGNNFHLAETEWRDFLSYENEGLMFEIHKKNRTVLEINVFRKRQ